MAGDRTQSQRTPGRIGSHLLIINPSITLRKRQRGDENGDSPSPNHPARCGNPSPTGRSLIGRGSYIGPAHPEQDRFHPQIKNRSIRVQLRLPGDQTRDPNWLELMEPARGDSCPSDLRRGPAAPGEDRVLSPDQKSFHISATPTNRRLMRRSPESILPYTVWKPQPYRNGC